MSEKNATKSYHGTELVEEEYDVLMELEGLLGEKEIPVVEKMEWNTSGFIVKNNHLVELRFYYQDLSTLPESIGNLKSLKELDLSYNNKLLTLPESIGDLKSLTNLGIRVEISTLPESIVELSSLKELKLSSNDFSTLPESITLTKLKSLEKLELCYSGILGPYRSLTTLPESIGNLTSLKELSLIEILLESLPESIGNLKSLKELTLKKNQLVSLPESIGNLTSLEKLDLEANSLSVLPESIGQLTSLKELNLYMNKFNILPYVIWPLKNLKKLKFGINPFILEEEKEIVKNAHSIILEYCRQKANISLFLSHAVNDQDYFKIKQISEYLEKQGDIYKVYFCEEDLKDDIDAFMNETVPKSHLLVFFASHKSVFNSKDCRHELNLAKSHKIPIIPIKGGDVEWDDLKKLGLNHTLGIEFDGSDFKSFCEKLYEYAKQFRHGINLFGNEGVKIEKLNIKITIDNFLDSEEFKEQLKTHLEEFQTLFQKLNNGKINLFEYCVESIQILSKTESNEGDSPQ